ncbi:cytochrome c oxidase subunit 3 [Rhizobium sp. L1K21]|uniref:cytochrome c oxidase subunit 3 n=1 Tax=Rhizobium sp. L1K21 TaxID=2954933 RepID=UPI002093D498|nr:cytochrome c oxidase subunit 3 [Rhizobium sp. L1K21]MCO6187778.1 cytochrome c oxidase subunit 3 [Rhizobium sp. L1K21]
MRELPKVQTPYVDRAQQHEAGIMGMHIFLASEIMLFGGIFMAIAVIRQAHSQEVVEYSKELHYYLGAINTMLLLTSSFLVAAAVHMSRHARRKAVLALLVSAAFLGLLFLGLKGFEYWSEFQEGRLPVAGGMEKINSAPGRLFLNLYLVSTSLHAVHLTIGVIALLVVAGRIYTRRSALPQRSVVVETTAAYWHLVDIIWIFLYPLLYLAR